MSDSVLPLIRYVIKNRITGAEVIHDLAHLHASTWTIKGIQPGAPGSSAVGDFTIQLFPPQSEQFKANWADYKQLLPGLAEGLRVEGYLDVIAGAPRYAGVITDVTIDSAGEFTLAGKTDVWIAQKQKPFPGELFTTDAGGANSLGRARLYTGENIVALTDQFNPFTAGNYTSSNLPTPSDTGTATAITATTLQDTTKTWASNMWTGATVTRGASTAVVAFNTINSVSFGSWTGGTPALGGYTLAGVAPTSGTWTGTTDPNGINSNVVTDSTGTGAILINKTGTAATGDTDNNHFVECIMRFSALTETDTANAGRAGIGLSSSGTGSSGQLLVGFATVKLNSATSRFDLDATLQYYAAGSLLYNVTIPNVLTDVGDPDGFVPLQFQLLANTYQTAFLINGSAVIQTTSTGFNPGTTTIYPLVYYAIPTTGSNPAYFTDLIHGVRNNDSALHTSAPFITGTTDSPAHSIGWLISPPPTFLDIWTQVATLETWFWRYTPVAMAAGTHPTMGTVDFQAAPGTDLSDTIFFREGENLASLRQQANADSFASDSRYNGAAGTDGAGIVGARNIAAMNAYGWLSDNDMSLNVNGWSYLQRQGGQIAANKGAPGSSFVARVTRDARTADKWRELDYVTVHCPSIAVYNKRLLVLAYTFTEGSAEQQLTLGQYGADEVGMWASLARMFPGIAIMAGAFKAR